MNTRNNYRSLLKEANKDLKHWGMKLVLHKEDGSYSLNIESSDGAQKRNYASGYYENELEELINDAWAFAKQEPLSKVRKLDINKRFQEFRDALTGDVYDALMEIGGTLDMGNASAKLIFDNLTDEYVDEEFRAVEALSLRADKERKGTVILTAVDCSEEEPETVEWDLSELSADELYNLLGKAEIFLKEAQRS